MRGRGLHTHPPGDGGGQREQILVVQVIGGQKGVLGPPGIAPAQPPPQHTHGITAAQQRTDGRARLPHKTADPNHRSPNRSHASSSPEIARRMRTPRAGRRQPPLLAHLNMDLTQSSSKSGSSGHMSLRIVRTQVWNLRHVSKSSPLK